MNTDSHYSNALSSVASGIADRDTADQELQAPDDGAWPGVAPPAGWFLLTKDTPATAAETAPTDAPAADAPAADAPVTDSPVTDSPVTAPAEEQTLLPTMARHGRAGGPGLQARQAPAENPQRPADASVWQRSNQLWAESGIQWERPPAQAVPQTPMYLRSRPQPAPARTPAGTPAPPQPAPGRMPVADPEPLAAAPHVSRRSHAGLLSHPVGRHARTAVVPPQARPPYADDPPVDEEYVATAAARGTRTASRGEPSSRTLAAPALAYVQLLGAPVQLSPQASSPPRHPDWADRPSFLLDPGLDPELDDEPEIPRAFLGRRVAAVGAPVLVLGMVGALAFTLLTGHGPKFDQLSSNQGNQPPQLNQSVGTGLATGAFATYPGLQQRGVFLAVNRIVASGTTIVATGQQTIDGVTRQQFYVSADGGATWQLAPVQGINPPGSIAPLLAGGPGGWLAIGPQAIWTSHDGLSWTLAATHGITQAAGDQVWVVTRTASGFVAGGADANGHGVVWTSADGLNWQRQTMGAHVLNIAYATAHGNAILITGALASGGSGAWLSTDGGSHWTTVTIPGTGEISGVAFDADGFLAVRGSKTYFSTNGVSWHNAGTIAASGGFHPRVVKGDGYGLVVAGQNDAGQLVAYLSTDDGASWRPTATLGNAAAESVVGAAVAPGDHVIAIGATAASPVSQRPVFLKGAHPVTLPGANIPELAVTALAAAGGQQIAVGSANGYPAIWHKTGDRWSLVTRPGEFGGQGLGALTAVAHGSSGWLAAGPNGIILTSPDGVTWHAVGGTAALAAADLVAAAAGPAGYVIAGDQTTQTGSAPAVWFSTNLTSWTKASGLGGSGAIAAVTATSHGFAAAGSANRQPAVWVSPDGRAWRLTDLSPAGATLRYIAASGGRMVVMGTNAAGAPLAMLSTNGGTSWQPVAVPSSGSGAVITALTADATGFIAIGESGATGEERIFAWTSSDGATWTPSEVGARLRLRWGACCVLKAGPGLQVEVLSG
ncbi:MAG: hypothetical protein JO345_40620 [Streptosporangiaceae bacterium]|nr:hypothetical protein [Streptosporangiaceae bacterium]